MPIQGKSAVQQNLPPLTTLVTFSEGKTYVVSILKPTHLSHFKVMRRKLKRFHTTHEATINAVSQPQFEANDNNDDDDTQNKFRLCLKQLRLAKWRRRHSRYGIWRCRFKFSELNSGPIEIVIPIEIKSMDNISNVHAGDKRVDRIKKVDEQSAFDGSESSYARLKNDAYYHSQVAVGDPIRAKRIKRIRRTITYGTKNVMTVMPLLNKAQAVIR